MSLHLQYEWIEIIVTPCTFSKLITEYMLSISCSGFMSSDVVHNGSRPITSISHGLPNCLPPLIMKTLPCVWITVIFFQTINGRFQWRNSNIMIRCILDGFHKCSLEKKKSNIQLESKYHHLYVRQLYTCVFWREINISNMTDVCTYNRLPYVDVWRFFQTYAILIIDNILKYNLKTKNLWERTWLCQMCFQTYVSHLKFIISCM